MLCLRISRCVLFIWIALAAYLGMPQSALAMETLRVLAWPGYADADLVTIFEQRHGVHVEVTLVDNDDILREKMAADQGAHFDVIAANTAEMVHYIDSGLIQPIDTQNIPNLRKQLPRFRPLSAIPGITRAGRVYAIPYTYSEMGLIYDRRRFKTAPSGYADLWNPRYAGQVLQNNNKTQKNTKTTQTHKHEPNQNPPGAR